MQTTQRISNMQFWNLCVTVLYATGLSSVSRKRSMMISPLVAPSITVPSTVLISSNAERGILQGTISGPLPQLPYLATGFELWPERF